eukprot:1474228-Rhodomonas_salina.1
MPLARSRLRVLAQASLDPTLLPPTPRLDLHRSEDPCVSWSVIAARPLASRPRCTWAQRPGCSVSAAH